MAAGVKEDRARTERAARIYTTNRDAALAMGVTQQAFGRMCARYGIETPLQRRGRQMQERKARLAQKEAQG